ncbi:protein TolR [Dyella sp. KRB-257]|uniref:protein TolR n=1 Tax=Dyella sp. KRB-257 TaxID=3400915 RepID=UPI003BFC4B68
MRPSHRKRHKLKSEINVVPYIDVMLVLLIIFMVTTPMLNANVDVNLPQANARALKDKKDPVIVSVGSDGSLFLTLGNARKEPIDEEGLKVKVGAFVKANPDISVLVAGDRDGKYDGVYRVLADLQQAGVAKVGLMSQPSQGTSASDGRK